MVNSDLMYSVGILLWYVCVYMCVFINIFTDLHGFSPALQLRQIKSNRVSNEDGHDDFVSFLLAFLLVPSKLSNVDSCSLLLLKAAHVDGNVVHEGARCALEEAVSVFSAGGVLRLR